MVDSIRQWFVRKLPNCGVENRTQTSRTSVEAICCVQDQADSHVKREVASDIPPPFRYRGTLRTKTRSAFPQMGGRLSTPAVQESSLAGCASLSDCWIIAKV